MCENLLEDPAVIDGSLNLRLQGEAQQWQRPFNERQRTMCIDTVDSNSLKGNFGHKILGSIWIITRNERKIHTHTVSIGEKRANIVNKANCLIESLSEGSLSISKFVYIKNYNGQLSATKMRPPFRLDAADCGLKSWRESICQRLSLRQKASAPVLAGTWWTAI